MDEQGHNDYSVRHAISTTWQRLRTQVSSRRRRGRPRDPGTLPVWSLSPSSRFVTCAHTSRSWFSTPEGDVDVESARATLRELLVESVIFGRISAFYPPHPAPSETKQSLARRELLAAFDTSNQRKGGSSARREPGRTPERKFTLFAQLPAEIRLQIWRAALPRHRTLHLGQSVDEPYSWTARLPIPTLSRVCRESREVVLGTVFPVYGRAPYRSGPGSSQDVTRRFITSWASDADCLDLGSSARPAALRCGDYLERIKDFDTVAQSLLGLFPWVRDDDESVRDTPDKFTRGVPRMMVVLQIVYISLRPPTPGDDEYTKVAWEDANPSLGGLPNIVEVGELINNSSFDVNKYDALVHRRPKEHHITTVASLYDRERIKELLSVGSVTGHWDDSKTPREAWPRLRAMHYQYNAFCMDCLLEWWEKQIHGIVQKVMTSAITTPQSSDGLDREPSGDPLPELVPAVRFKIQWPGLEEYEEDSRAT